MTRSVVYGPSVTLDAGGNKWVNLADGVSASDAATVGQIAGTSVTYGTPAIALGTSAAAGSIDEAIRRDSTIVAFDATVPSTQAFGDSAAAGTAAVAARRDHKHAMPANPFAGASAGGALDGTYPNPGLAAGVAGAGLAETSDVLSVNVDASTIEINADTLRVKADGITANEIAANAVGSSELASTAVTPTTYGDATHVGQFTVDADGRLTAASSVAITPGAAAAGTSALVYRYTVTGSDKASIDTGVDAADAGSSDWTNGDLLEVFMYLRTDEAVLSSLVDLTFNNDTGANYDRETESSVSSSVSAGAVSGVTSLQFFQNGASRGANYFSLLNLVIPDYAGTVGFKPLTAHLVTPDSTGGNNGVWQVAANYRSTSAITRLKVLPDTALKKFKVGSQISIYKRTAS